MTQNSLFSTVRASRFLLSTSVLALLAAPSFAQTAQASSTTAQALEEQMKSQTSPPSMPAPSAPVAAPAPTESDLPVPTGDIVAAPPSETPSAEKITTQKTSTSQATEAVKPQPVAQESEAPPPAPTPVLAPTKPEEMTTQAPRVATAAGATDRIVNLRDAVAVGVLTNPGTEAVQNNRRATDEELRQAKALWAPSLDLRADSGWEYTKSDPDNGTDVDETLFRSQASLTLTQMLFDGFETKYENLRQKHRVRSAAHRVRETAEFTALDVTESYIDVLRQRELLAIAQQNTKQHEDILVQIQDGESAGRSTQADVEQTVARLAAARATEANVRQSLLNAENNFRRRVGDVPQPDLMKPPVPSDLLEANIEDEVKQALTHNPTLDIREADVNVANAEWKGSGSTMYPQVDLQLGATAGRNTDGVEGDASGASALVVANWNLFRGGADEARTREFVYRHAQAKSQRNDTARAVENDVRQTWASRDAAAQRAEQFARQAEANAQVVQAYKDQFNLDRRTLLDVLDAQNEWFVSRSNAINNDYLTMFANYRLLALRGALVPTLGVAYPKEVNPKDKSSG
jgi:outer membrane protein, adhesin transport system